MPILKIYQDSRGPGICRSCGAVIEWAELMSGKRHPFDRIIVRHTQFDMLNGREVQEVHTDDSPSHFQTCPDAVDWRRRRERMGHHA
jgi:hypothetical protein